MVAQHWDSGFMRYSHEALGRHAGLSDAELEALREGRWDAFDGEERLVARTSLLLAGDGDLDDGAYAAAEAALGESGLFELLTLVGYYATLALQLRVFRIGLPDPLTPPKWRSGPTKWRSGTTKSALRLRRSATSYGVRAASFVPECHFVRRVCHFVVPECHFVRSRCHVVGGRGGRGARGCRRGAGGSARGRRSDRGCPRASGAPPRAGGRPPRCQLAPKPTHTGVQHAARSQSPRCRISRARRIWKAVRGPSAQMGAVLTGHSRRSRRHQLQLEVLEDARVDQDGRDVLVREPDHLGTLTRRRPA